MAIQRVDLDSQTTIDSVSLTAAGTVTNSVRVEYDDTKTKDEIIESLEKAKLAIIKLIP